MTALAAIINDLGPFISKIEAKNVSEQWLNTNLSILGNKTPLQAVKYKKYFKKIREIINDLELIYESRTSNDEPFIDPRYVVKRLEINGYIILSNGIICLLEVSKLVFMYCINLLGSVKIIQELID